MSTLAARRLALSVRSPRSLVLPVMNPALFALVLAPALANTVATPSGRNAYMTFLALATVGLLIPLNALFSGIGVVVDRQHGAMRELLVAPIRRSTIVLGNLVAALAVTALQIAVLIALSAARGAAYVTGVHIWWFMAAALVFSVLMYSVAEILATRLRSAEAYTGALPVVAIVPFFFAGSLFPITALPGWLDDIAKVLPLTHALALFRYGLTSTSGARALHNIWGMTSVPAMAALSLGVIALYAVVAFNLLSAYSPRRAPARQPD
ncbi:MAG TPA: ABC transporter permease [Acidimicrobiales bacterium]|nr:ABC transporter permease [Acidimicrobiales bacterium]